MTVIIEEIRKQLEQGSQWELSADRVRELLGMDHGEFYQRIYEETLKGNPLVDISTATRRFRQENVAELVTLLELFVGPEAQQTLERAGLFFPHGQRFEILGSFLRIAGETAAEHAADHEVFAAMLYEFGNYRRARGAYLDEYFSISELIDRTTETYLSFRRFVFPAVAAANVRRLIEEYFSRHVLERETVLAPVCAQLFETAVAEGFERRPEDEWAEAQREYRERERRAWGRAGDRDRRRRTGRGADGGFAREYEDREQWARRVMELDTQEKTQQVTKPRLKAAYKALMKRYHPDVNPSGLQACQRINEAYTILLASIKVSS